jgi:hypothetical protein
MNESRQTVDIRTGIRGVNRPVELRSYRSKIPGRGMFATWFHPKSSFHPPYPWSQLLTTMREPLRSTMTELQKKRPLLALQLMMKSRTQFNSSLASAWLLKVDSLDKQLAHEQSGVSAGLANYMDL